jgi:hypothetical protein
MRTTLDIADDVLHAAKERARLEQRTIGAVISDLARCALAARAPEPATPYGFRPFPKRGATVTNRLINRLRDSGEY